MTARRIANGLVIVAAVLMLLPIAWVVGLSFKPNAELMADVNSVFHPPYTLTNYGNIFGSSSVFRWIGNSLIVSLGMTAGVLILSSLAGYAFARLEFPGRKWWFLFVMAGLAIPEQAVIIARHQLFSALEMHNSYPALILPGLSAPFGVFLMTQYFRAIPKEYDEAALLDGASRWTIFWKVLLPLTIPAQATLGIFTFVTGWNDYWWPLISATRASMFTLTVGIASSQMNFAQTEGLGFLMAQAVFAGLPIFIVYLFFQKYIVQAVAGAAGAMRLLLAAALALNLLALDSCAPTPLAKTEIVVQRFFGSCDADYGRSTNIARAEGECGIVTTLVNKFQADNPDVHVRVNVVFWPGYDQLTAQMAANDAPDLVTMHASVVSDYEARGLLTPIGEDLKRAGVDPADFTDAAAKSVTIDGQIYGMPFDNWAQLWHVNMGLMRKAGLVRGGKPVLPHTADELLAQAEQFKRATGKPYFVQITANEYAAYARILYNYLIQQNSDFFANPKKIHLQTPEAKRILTLFKALRDRGLSTVNQDYSAATSSFLNGGGGILLNGTWMVGTFDLESKKPGSALAGGYAVRPFPSLFGGKPIYYVDGHNWVMPTNDRRTSAQKDAALRLLKFFASHDGDWARTGHLPAFRSVTRSVAFRALPHRSDYLVLSTNGTPLPRGVRRQYPIETVIGEECAAAINGLKPIDQALADAEHRINALLSNV